MRVFITWSGARSRTVASRLREWLPDVIHFLNPWMSEADIPAGTRWGREVDEALSETRFGILCLTPENVNAPWIVFEAGALAKTIEDTYVCPYLIGLTTAELPQGPLTRFQAKVATRSGTWELLEAINTALGDDARRPDQLERAFDRFWPDLGEELEKLPEPESPPEPVPVEEMVEEILDHVRELSRRASSAVPRAAPTFEPGLLGIAGELLKGRPSSEAMPLSAREETRRAGLLDPRLLEALTEAGRVLHEQAEATDPEDVEE